MKDYLFAAGLTFFVIVICPIVWWTWDHVKNYVKEGWKERFGFILILLLLTSCGTPKRINREMNMIFTVAEIKGDSARLETPLFHIPYYVASKDLVVGEERFFMLYIYDAEVPREYRAKIRNSFPVDNKEEIRRALRHKRYLNL